MHMKFAITIAFLCFLCYNEITAGIVPNRLYNVKREGLICINILQKESLQDC